VGAAAGKQILLTAARTVAQAAAPATGRYYVTPAEAGNFLRVGSPGDRYVILALIDTQQWSSNSKGSSPLYSQALHVQLASAADLAAWRRAGSPTTWDVQQDTGAAVNPSGFTDAYLRPLTAGPGPLTGGSVEYGAPPFSMGAKLLSASQLRALPANPAKLKALLMTGYYPLFGSRAAICSRSSPMSSPTR
jgi:hypothetical protein